MKRMQSVYRVLLLVLISFSTMTGCIYETLPECPPSLSLAPVFTFHTEKDADGTPKDLFGTTAREVTAFLFDSEGRFLVKFSESGPFRNGYHMTCPVTDAGEYYAVMWVNQTSSTNLNITTPVQGITTLQEFLLSLKEIENSVITQQFEPLLYGQTAKFTITNSRPESQVIPVSLLRNTNKVQVTVRWRDRDSKELCKIHSHSENTRMYIQDTNGIMNFENELCPCKQLTYIPRYFSGEELEVYKDPEHPDAVTLAGQFSVMRLLTDSKTKLVFKTVNENGVEEPGAEYNLMEWIRKTKAYDTQEALDREETFHVYLEFFCDEDIWTAVNITINGWRVSNMDGEDL